MCNILKPLSECLEFIFDLIRRRDRGVHCITGVMEKFRATAVGSTHSFGIVFSDHGELGEAFRIHLVREGLDDRRHSGFDGTFPRVADLPENALRCKEPGHFGVLVVLPSRVGEMPAYGFDAFGSTLSLHRCLIFAVTGTVSAFGDVPDGNRRLRKTAVRLSTRPLKQEQER